MFNTTEGDRAIRDSFTLREAVLKLRVPYFTTVPGAAAAVQAIRIAREGPLAVASLQSYFRNGPETGSLPPRQGANHEQ